MFKIKTENKIGIILLLISFILIFTPFLDYPIRLLTQPLLMGSSKGKDILLFLIIGLFLILSCVFEMDFMQKISFPHIFKHENKRYRSIIFWTFLILSIIGIITEILIRNELNINIYTIFNAMNPSITSTSILHSHIYKSVFGDIAVNILPFIPKGIYTGNSLSPYIPNYIRVLFCLIPIMIIIMIKTLVNEKIYSKILLSVSYALLIIGLIDGGLFATPFIGGLYGLLLLKFDSPTTSYWLSKKTETKDLGEIENKNFIVKKINDYKQIFIFAIPHILLIIIIILRFTIAFTGSNVEYYEVNIQNPENINLDSYNTIKTIETDNHTTKYLSPDYNEMELENSLNKELERKCEYYTLSWNTYSY